MFPYKSSPPALTDVIAGRVSMMFIDVPTGLPHVNAKALKALAGHDKETFGLVAASAHHGRHGERFRHHLVAGLPRSRPTCPRNRRHRLNAEIRKIIERPDIKSQLAERGMEAFSGTPEEFDAFLKEQLVLWEKLIADAGIEKQ
jgi:tripartite-type tricarboxylate transporter receptor subunit TctC